MNGLRFCKSLHFGAVAANTATDKAVRLTRDFATRSNLCLATNLCTNNLKDSHASTLSSWSLKIDRISASPDAAEVRYTQTPLRVLLLSDYEAAAKHEYQDSRKIFVMRTGNGNLEINDRQKLVHVPACSAWGVMPAFDATQGKPMYKNETQNAHSERHGILITVSAPDIGVAPEGIRKSLQLHGFSFSSDSSLCQIKRLRQLSRKSSDTTPKDEMVTMARRVRILHEKNTRPGTAVREREQMEAIEKREERARKRQFCENCSCEGCMSKKQKMK